MTNRAIETTGPDQPETASPAPEAGPATARWRPGMLMVLTSLSIVVSWLFPSASMVWPASQPTCAEVAVTVAVNTHQPASGDLLDYQITAGHNHGPPTTVDDPRSTLHTYYVVAGITPVLVHNCGNGNNGIGFSPGEGASPLTPDRLQHGTRHLTDAGVLPNWRGSTSPQTIKDKLAPILENPITTFNSDLGGTKVRGFIGQLPNTQGTMQPVAIMVFSEGTNAGKLATAVVPSPNQMLNWFVG